MANFKLDVKVEKEKLIKSMDKLASLIGINMEEGSLMAANMAIRSAAKATPPFPGRNIPVKAYKRNIIKLSDKYGRTSYKVPFHNSMSSGKKFFKNISDASEFSKIKFRGIGRAGWFLNLHQINGETLPAWASSIVNRSPSILTKNVSDLKIQKSGGRWADRISISISNKTDGISRYAAISEAVGYRSAANGINGWMRRLAREASIL